MTCLPGAPRGPGVGTAGNLVFGALRAGLSLHFYGLFRHSFNKAQACKMRTLGLLLRVIDSVTIPAEEVTSCRIYEELFSQSWRPPWLHFPKSVSTMPFRPATQRI